MQNFDKQCAQSPVFIRARLYIRAFLENRPYFGDLVQVQRVIELFGKQVNKALNVH